MSVDKNLEKELDDFSTIVQKEFNFLVDDYGFTRNELKKLDFESAKDKHVKIDYVNNFLCVQIDWYLVDCSMGVGLIELEDGRMTNKFSYFGREGLARAVSLSTLVEFLTNGKVKNPLPHFGPKASGRKAMKADREREKLINEDKQGILATYSSWLREYATDILKGDTSIFEVVQRYGNEKRSREYYGY